MVNMIGRTWNSYQASIKCQVHIKLFTHITSFNRHDSPGRGTASVPTVEMTWRRGALGVTAGTRQSRHLAASSTGKHVHFPLSFLSLILLLLPTVSYPTMLSISFAQQTLSLEAKQEVGGWYRVLSLLALLSTMVASANELERNIETIESKKILGEMHTKELYSSD